MGNLLDSLKNYFENTPKNVLDKDWKEIEYLNDIGPDVFEYVDFVKRNFILDSMEYSKSRKGLDSHKFDVPVTSSNNEIAADAKYCLAA